METVKIPHIYMNFSRSELGMIKELVENIEIGLPNKERKQSLAAIKSFLQSMRTVRGNKKLFKMELVSITRIYNVETQDTIYRFELKGGEQNEVPKVSSEDKDSNSL